MKSIPSSLWYLDATSTLHESAELGSQKFDEKLKAAFSRFEAIPVAAIQPEDVVAVIDAHYQKSVAMPLSGFEVDRLISLLAWRDWLEPALPMLHCCLQREISGQLPYYEMNEQEFIQLARRLGSSIGADERLSDRCLALGAESMARIVDGLVSANEPMVLCRLPASYHTEASLDCMMEFHIGLLNRYHFQLLTDAQWERFFQLASQMGLDSHTVLERVNREFPFRKHLTDGLIRFEGNASATEAARSLMAARHGLIEYQSCAPLPVDEYRQIARARWEWYFRSRSNKWAYTRNTSTPLAQTHSDVCLEFRAAMGECAADTDLLKHFLRLAYDKSGLVGACEQRKFADRYTGHLEAVLSAMTPSLRLASVVEYARLDPYVRRLWVSVEQREQSAAGFQPMTEHAVVTVFANLPTAEQSSMVGWLLKCPSIKPEHLIAHVRSKARQRELMDLTIN